MSEHLDFSLSLHTELPADQNFCWSPYSVASALALASTAASGRTRDELVQALRAGTGDDLLKLLSAAANVGDDDPDGPVLAVANTLWAHEKLSVHDSYLRALSAWPGSAVRNAPFRADPDKARREINADVAETTRDLIPELLQPGTVDSDTVAALVNALYLKTSWSEPFDRGATKDEPFHAPSGDRQVPTMHVTRRMGYATHDGWQVATIPAAGGVEAIVLLPESDLEVAEATLNSAAVGELISAVSPQRVALSMPKFKVTGDSELQAPLRALGVETMFSRHADFSALSDDPLNVSTVVHESVLRIDEAGLEGAAATAVMMRLTAVVREDEPIQVQVNRPFLFLVRHKETGVLYFVARVSDPA